MMKRLASIVKLPKARPSLCAYAPTSSCCILSEDLQVLRSFPIPFPEVSDILQTLNAVLPLSPKSVFFAAECSQPRRRRSEQSRTCPRESRRALAQMRANRVCSPCPRLQRVWKLVALKRLIAFSPPLIKSSLCLRRFSFFPLHQGPRHVLRPTQRHSVHRVNTLSSRR